ncbi:alpha/beta hydrolase family protein [Amycolatopsis jejuensis]|uniref:alpha/beta hydrolase family protein n=1 Tax=Amycolatopsis jejuensis TaxID=330084 RepID=UPI0005268D39|nr:alpha/beta hydrolase [Amycolatopsis jejuensis]
MRTATETGTRSGFFADARMNSMARAMLGRVYTAAADTGETLTTIDRIVDGDLGSWAAEWEATAGRVAAIGDDCVRRGHRVSGRNALLRAATYYAACVLVADGCREPDVVRARTFAAYRRCWEQYLSLLDNSPEPLEIPYEDTTMPGWFFAAPGDGPKPTLVMVNGADGAASYLWPGYGSEAAQRGYHVVVFDGPGQQRMLFERGIPFRPDWEHVLTPVVDLTLGLPGVDPERLALYAVSQGGYWAPRALAFEHRFAAAVIDDGVVDVSAAWHAMLSPELRELLANGERDAFDAAIELLPAPVKLIFTWRANPYRCPTFYDTFLEAARYEITPELAARITTPVLIADPDQEGYFAGQPERLYDMIPGEKVHVRFTEAEGAAGHCEPMARSLAAQRFFDFLDDHVGITGS